MSFKGARGIVAVSQNAGCELIAAMVVEQIEDLEFYTRVAGPFPGEYGERASTLRRGKQFERYLYERKDDRPAFALCETLGPAFGYQPQAMRVLDLREIEGSGVLETADLRLRRTRQELQSLRRGEPVAHVILQPQLSLSVGSGDTRFIVPDALVLVTGSWAGAGPTGPQMYIPLEIKSSIVRRNIAENSSKDRARRQAAVEVLALAEEARRCGLFERVRNRAAFIYATPQGLTPTRPFIEDLYAETAEVLRALAALREARGRLSQLRRESPGPLESLTGQLRTTYLDRCKSICALAILCKQEVASRASVLGDAPRAVLGADTELSRLIELIQGARPESAFEAQLAPQLQEAAASLGYLPAA
ncbi:MAG TPA: hypothetical protein VND68_14890 [Chloroflexia bacterium]|nr:hypothetical protein [Chloroflexia bacterium]